MTNKMVERATDAVRATIAKMKPDMLVAMANETGPTDLTPFSVIASAVIEAMREPTQEMIEGAWAYALDEDAGAVWRSMINTALL